MTGTSTTAPRVLVVEDEYLIRMLLEEMLDELGYGVAAAVGTISEARKLATDGEFSAAILDVNLDGQEIYPLPTFLPNVACHSSLSPVTAGAVYRRPIVGALLCRSHFRPNS
jgi:DNA-binding NtrC family response regulator